MKSIWMYQENKLKPMDSISRGMMIQKLNKTQATIGIMENKITFHLMEETKMIQCKVLHSLKNIEERETLALS